MVRIKVFGTRSMDRRLLIESSNRLWKGRTIIKFNGRCLGIGIILTLNIGVRDSDWWGQIWYRGLWCHIVKGSGRAKVARISKATSTAFTKYST